MANVKTTRLAHGLELHDEKDGPCNILTAVDQVHGDAFRVLVTDDLLGEIKAKPEGERLQFVLDHHRDPLWQCNPLP